MDTTFLNVLTDNPIDSIVITDLKGIYLAVSQKKADNWGRTQKEMQGLSDHILMAPDEAEASWNLSKKVIETGKPVMDALQKVNRNGKEIYYSISKYLSSTIIAGEKIDFIVSISRDITKRMEIEELVKTDLHAILHEQKGIAVGHNGLINYVVSSLYKGKDRKAIEILKSMQAECANSESRIMMANLRIAQLGIERPEIPEAESIFDLRELFDSVYEQHKPSMHGIQLDDTMHLIEPQTVYLKTVKDWVRFAIENSWSNEIKYGQIITKITYGFEMDFIQNRAIINISSNGIKIDEEFAKTRLFKKGQRAKETSSKEGTGFGLWAAREYMRQLGGEMWYEPENDGEWMGFYISLPLDLIRSKEDCN